MCVPSAASDDQRKSETIPSIIIVSSICHRTRAEHAGTSTSLAPVLIGTSCKGRQAIVRGPPCVSHCTQPQTHTQCSTPKLIIAHHCETMATMSTTVLHNDYDYLFKFIAVGDSGVGKVRQARCCF